MEAIRPSRTAILPESQATRVSRPLGVSEKDTGMTALHATMASRYRSTVVTFWPATRVPSDSGFSSITASAVRDGCIEGVPHVASGLPACLIDAAATCPEYANPQLIGNFRLMIRVLYRF